MRFIYLSPPTYLIFFSLLYFPVHRYCHFLSCLLFHVFLSAIFFLVCCFMSSCLLFPFLQLHYHLTVISPLSYSLAITLSLACHFLFFPYYFHVISSFLACHFLSAFLPLRYHLVVVFLLSFLPFPFCLPTISFLLACYFLPACLPFSLLVYLFFFLSTILTLYFHFKFHV